ncbi:MAG TPA: cytochrome P460 family protein [Gemmatimonadaceae bacterium]|nr:cytochrome P460 family protein [Gemmatimonadaceae bacterium]
MKFASGLCLLASLGGVLAWRTSASTQAPVPYPDGYRNWVHVKSTAVGPAHKSFATMGGFQHIYANPQAVTGYRTRVFPEGSTIVFDWLEMQDQAGAFTEGPRRQTDVMVKDSVRFASTGGWGFQRFVKDSKTELAAEPTPQQCFACHDQLKKDGLVLSSFRP